MEEYLDEIDIGKASDMPKLKETDMGREKARQKGGEGERGGGEGVCLIRTGQVQRCSENEAHTWDTDPGAIHQVRIISLHPHCLFHMAWYGIATV